MGMTMNEALVAGTLNAAASLGHSDMYGSLEVGKFGDMLILDAPQWEHLFYRISDEPILKVIKKGKVIDFFPVCSKHNTPSSERSFPPVRSSPSSCAPYHKASFRGSS